MTYQLNVEHLGYLLNEWFSSKPLRKIEEDFRERFSFPISSSTIYRRLWDTLFHLDEGLTLALSEGELHVVVGDIWEIDGKVLPGVGGRFIIVRDLKTGFILGGTVSETEDEEAAKTVYQESLRIARKGPKVVRCDGNPAFKLAAQKFLKSKVEVHVRIGRTGQNQAIEGTFSDLETLFKIRRGLHSKDRENAYIVLRGWIHYKNFVKRSSTLGYKTPAEAAGLKHLKVWCENRWIPLLSISNYHFTHRKNLEKIRKLREDFLQKRKPVQITLSAPSPTFPNQTHPQTGKKYEVRKRKRVEDGQKKLMEFLEFDSFFCRCLA